MFEKMHDILEEPWVNKGIVQECWIEGYEGFWKWSKYHSLWILENWKLDKTYRAPEESWVWDIDKRIVLDMQRTAISLVMTSFAGLKTLARTKILSIEDVKCLEQVFFDLVDSRTRNQMRHVLRSLGTNA